MAPPNVVVIGGGFAGVTVAKKLKGIANVVIVDRKDYFDITMANVRSVLDPLTANDATFLYKDCKSIGKFVQGNVVGLSANAAQLESGEVVPFDYAVIAVGSSYAASWAKGVVPSRAARLAELKVEAQKIKDAKNVLVVGGGPVAVEAAAEVLEAYAGKKVTIVTNGSALLEDKPKISGKALKWMQEKGATVIFNDRVDDLPARLPAVITTKAGKTLQADYVLLSTGIRLNTDFLRPSLGHVMDQRGAIKVNNHLQVQGYNNIWALGDCNDVKETKLGYLAALQGELTAKNIAAAIKGGKQKAWVPFNGTPAMFVTLGRKTGTGVMGSCVCPGFMVGSIKSKDLFVGKMRKELMT